MATVLVLVTTADGAADKVALQALTLGRELAAGGPVHALVIGDDAVAAGLGEWGATHVHVAKHPALDVRGARCRAPASSTTSPRASAPASWSAPAPRRATRSSPVPRPAPGSRSPPTAPR